MLSKLYQPLSTHLTIRRGDRHWAPLNPNQPHQSWPVSVTLTFSWMSTKIKQKQTNLFVEPACLRQVLCLQDSLWMPLSQNTVDIDPTWWRWGPGSAQEPSAVPRDGGWGGHSADTVPLCQDTHPAPTCSSLGLKTIPFLQHQRDWSCERENYRGAMQPSGQDPPKKQLQSENFRLSCLKHCA